MSRGYARLGAGITEAMQNASSFIKSIEDQQSLKISCIEETSSRRGFINEKRLKKMIDDSPNEYGNYLKQLIAN